MTSTQPKAEVILSRGPWAQIIAIRNVLCPDGRRRTARVGTPDTFFSAPARVHAYGKTVSGFVTRTDDDSEDWKFIPTDGRKNSAAFQDR